MTPGGVQQTQHGVEVFLALGAVVVQQAGRFVGDAAAFFLLAVQHAQGVGLHAAGAVLAQLVTAVLAVQIVHQGLLEQRAAVGAAQGVELERQILEAQRGEEAREHDDQVRVGIGAVGAQAFAVDLVELAHAALLGRS